MNTLESCPVLVWLMCVISLKIYWQTKKKKAYLWSTKHEKCMFVRLLLGNFVMQVDSSGKQGRARGHHCYDLDLFFHPVWNCLRCLRGWKGYSSDFKVFPEDLWERFKKEICQNWAWILGLMWVKLHRNQKAHKSRYSLQNYYLKKN